MKDKEGLVLCKTILFTVVLYIRKGEYVQRSCIQRHQSKPERMMTLKVPDLKSICVIYTFTNKMFSRTVNFI